MTNLNPYRAQRSSTRTMRTDPSRPKVKGARTGPKSSPIPGASAQGQALSAPELANVDMSRPPEMQWAPPESMVHAQLTNPPFYRTALAEPLYSGYAAGGFEGVQNVANAISPPGTDWFSLPEWQRKQILDSARAPVFGDMDYQ